MTLQYLGTAKLNATPRLDHIDTPEQQAPVYTCLDTLIADMHAAADETRRAIRRKKMADGEHVSLDTILDNQEIYDLVLANPGITMVQAAKRLHVAKSRLDARLKTLHKWGCIRFKWIPGITKKVRAYYAVEGAKVEQPPKQPKPAPVRDKVIAFLKANPGANTQEVADHLGVTRSKASTHIGRAKQVINIRTEHAQQGDKTPARHWVEE